MSAPVEHRTPALQPMGGIVEAQAEADAPAPARPDSITVAKGDTLFSLAQTHQVSLDALIAENEIADPRRLAIGTVLRLPPPTRYVVQPGDTLSEIADRHGMDMRSLAVLNDIAPDEIAPGDVVSLPAFARLDAPPMGAPEEDGAPREDAPGAADAAAPTPAPTFLALLDDLAALPAAEEGEIAAPAPLDPVPAALPPPPSHQGSARNTPPPPPDATAPAPDGDASVIRAAAATTAAPAPEAASAPALDPGPPPAAAVAPRFIWPLEGEVIARFGPGEGARRRDGLAIAADMGAPVRAAAEGEVVFAGALRGYGRLVLVRHDSRWISAYAHLDHVLPDEGDQVAQGEVIGRAGDSGAASRPQLHFELRRDGRAVDPLPALPNAAG